MTEIIASTMPGVKSLPCKHASTSTCDRCRQRIVADSFILTASGLVLKVILGILCGSQAVLADAVHSLMDTIAFGVNYAGAGVETRLSWATPYRQKVIIGCLILLSGVWLCAGNAALLICGTLAHPGLWSLVLAGSSAVVNFRLHKRSNCLSKQTDDPDIRVCAVQNRTNFWASCVALVGVSLAEFGALVFDPIGAFIIGTLLVGGGFAVFRESFAQKPPAAGWTKRSILRTATVLSCVIIGIFAVRVYTTVSRRDIILVPAQGTTLDSPVDNVLGRAQYFVIVDRARQTITPLVNANRFQQGDVSNGLVATVKAYDVDVVLAEKVGTEMFADLRTAGVRVFYFEGPQSVGRAVSDFQSENLSFARAPNVSRRYGLSGIGWMQPW
jgi:predicted Fe-Mo cluster-binding NifX family protein